MKKRAVINIAIILLIVLGIVIIYMGVSGAKVIWPPVITGLGFFVIGLAIYNLQH